MFIFSPNWSIFTQDYSLFILLILLRWRVHSCKRYRSSLRRVASCRTRCNGEGASPVVIGSTGRSSSFMYCKLDLFVVGLAAVTGLCCGHFRNHSHRKQWRPMRAFKMVHAVLTAKHHEALLLVEDCCRWRTEKLKQVSISSSLAAMLLHILYAKRSTPW